MSWEPDPESQHQFSIVQERRKNFESPALTHGPKKPPKMESGVDSCKRVQERLSKQSKGNADPVILERGRTVETNTSWGQESMREEMEKILSEKLAVLQRQLEMTQQAIPPMKEMTNTWASLQKLPENMQTLQKGLENLQVSTKEDLQTLRADLEERVSKSWNTPEMPESKENLVEMENQAGRTVETNTSWGQESMREEMEKILSEKLAVLQRQLEMTQQAIPPMKEMTNTWASLQKLPENMQTLQKGLENLQVSTKEDLQMLRADLEERVSKSWNTPERSESKENLVEVENQAGRKVEMTSVAMESMREEMEKIVSEKLAALQRQLEMTQQAIPPMKEMTNTWASLQKLPENMQALQKGLENLQVSTKEDLQMLRADLKGFFIEQRYKVDVTLNADTAHPRLEVSEDGKSVTDTGVIRQVPGKEERFDSHTFLLAKEGYTSGRQYWVVNVGKRRNWILGVASESVARKGTMTLSPENGFWVIGLADGEEYWAHTDPWTRLTVSGKPEKIGIFLNISANKLSFYNAKKKTALYTFTSIGGSKQERKFIPFFSTGSGVSVHDTEPLKIVQEFDDDD